MHIAERYDKEKEEKRINEFFDEGVVEPGLVEGVYCSDGVLKCKDCKKEFIIEASEVRFFYDNNLFLPKRCPECRAKKRSQK